MKRLTLLAFALAVAPLALAQLYKSVDKDGKVIYSDQPPATGESKQINAPPPPAAGGSKSFVERDKELEKARAANRDNAKKSEQTARKAQEDQERCNHARHAFETYSAGGRIIKPSTTGERAFMDEQEIEVAKEKARRDMDEVCKKG
jgi:hypothetical protein